MFQFPNLFPKFEDTRPVDITAPSTSAAATGTDETKPNPQATTNGTTEKPKDVKPDIKPDIKPTPAQLRGNAKKYGIKPPEGRIGSLVIMRSGRVKMVLGDGIVMDVRRISRWREGRVVMVDTLLTICRYHPESRLHSSNNWSTSIIKPKPLWSWAK